MDIRRIIQPLNYEDFGDFLLERNFHEEVVSLFVSQRVSGAAFLRLPEDDLKRINTDDW